jgi:hypothetical protein
MRFFTRAAGALLFAATGAMGTALEVFFPISAFQEHIIRI